MTKSEKNIEKDLFRLIKASPLATMVTGQVYRKGMRPENSKLEDIVVKFLAGFDGQIQSGIVVLSIYVPNITQLGCTRKVENTARVEELENAVLDFVKNCADTEYLYEFEDSMTSLDVEEIDQHAINARIHYQRLTED